MSSSIFAERECVGNYFSKVYPFIAIYKCDIYLRSLSRWFEHIFPIFNFSHSLDSPHHKTLSIHFHLFIAHLQQSLARFFSHVFVFHAHKLLLWSEMTKRETKFLKSVSRFCYTNTHNILSVTSSINKIFLENSSLLKLDGTRWMRWKLSLLVAVVMLFIFDKTFFIFHIYIPLFSTFFYVLYEGGWLWWGFKV